MLVCKLCLYTQLSCGMCVLIDTIHGMWSDRIIALLVVVVLDVVLVAVTMSSTAWVRYCPDAACGRRYSAGLLNAETFCAHDQRCIDAMELGVFAVLCSSLVCRTWFLYVCVVAMYRSESQRVIYGMMVVYDILAVVVSQYTFSLVVFLKLNGNQHTNFSDVGWPYYVNWGGIALSVAAFYAQPVGEARYVRTRY